ncbi:helix-turn-helix domain-containing protein [Cerasibacillus sp. JNUCC 74]
MIKIETGSLIKLERKKRNMTQEELSEGIVSVSYLSKIENNKADVNPNTIKLLCNRLGIEINDNEKKYLEVEKKCKEWYDMLFDRYDKRVMTEKYEELQQLISTNINDQAITFEIHKIRYYIVLRDFKKALKQINDLHEMVDTFSDTHAYYWYKFKGDYYSFKEDYQQSMQCYQLAEEKIRLANIDEVEIADLHYALSIAHSKLLNGMEAINYAKKAMTVFQRDYNFVRCAQCHILLGISYQRIKMNDIAIKNYNQAMRLGKLENDEQIIQLTHLNLGRFYLIAGESKQSIKNYSLALTSGDLDCGSRLEAITRLMQFSYKNSEYLKAKEYLRLGEDTLSLVKGEEYYRFYNYIIQAYAKLFAGHLEKKGRYKEAMQYYKLATSSYDKIIKLGGGIEDEKISSISDM